MKLGVRRPLTQRSLRKMRQDFSWALARSQGARSRAWSPVGLLLQCALISQAHLAA